MKNNKMNLAFFISVACTFTLSIAMEAPKEEVETTSLESTLLNLANMPVEIKTEIINHFVNNIIEKNKNLYTIELIKLIAKNLLPLRRINSEFETIIDDYISQRHGLSKTLRTNGIDINQKNDKGNTALISAIINQQPKLAELIIQLGANVNEKNNNNGHTALMWAAMEGYKDIVQLLIDHGANVSEKDDYGNNAFMLAARRYHFNLLRLLVVN